MISVLWVDLFVSMFESYLFFKFMKVRQNIRASRHETLGVAGLGILIFFKTPLSMIGWNEGILILALLSIQLVMAVYFFTGNMKGNLVSVLVFFLILVASESIVLGSILLLEGISVEALQVFSGLKMVGVFLSKSVLFVIIQVYMNRSRKINYELVHGRMITEIALMLIVLVFLAFLVLPMGIDINDQASADISGTMILAYAIASTALIVLYERMAERIQIETRIRAENKLYIEQGNYYRKFDHMLIRYNQVRHDVNKHIAILYHYAMQERLDDIQRYTAELHNEVSSEKELVVTPSNVVNCLMSYYIPLAKEQGVFIEFSHDLSCPVQVSDTDMCIVIGNLVENAVDATQKQTHTEKKVEISIRSNQSTVVIECTNPHCENVKESNGKLLSNKDPALHSGLGLSNVRHVSKCYDGDLSVEYSDRSFYVSVILQNPLNQMTHENDQTA